MSTKRACDRLSSTSREPMAADTWPTRVTPRHDGAGWGGVAVWKSAGEPCTLRHLLATAAALGSSKPHTIKSLETFAGESCGDGMRRRTRRGGGLR
jgi:hypothetical protein